MMAPQLSVVFLGHPQPRDGGDWLHRARWPAEALQSLASVTTVQTTHAQWLEISLKADVLVVLMLVEPVISRVISVRKMLGKATVYEISDDFKAFQEGNPQKSFYVQPGVHDLIESLAQEADALQFSSNFLKSKYGYLNKNNRVIKNQLGAFNFPIDREYSLGAPVIGWSGSSGHLQDVIELAQWLASWPLHRKVIWRVMASPALIKAFRKSGLKVEAVSTGSMEDYLYFLSNIDVCVIWTGADDFSRGRSDGKFLEAASQGVAVLCRRNDAYEDSIRHDVDGLFFYSRTELHALLDELLHSNKKIRRLGMAAQKYVLCQRTHERAAAVRFNFYEKLTEKRTGVSVSFSEVCHFDFEGRLYQALAAHKSGDFACAISHALYLMEKGFHSLLLWTLLQDTSARLGNHGDALLFRQQAEIWLERQFESCL